MHNLQGERGKELVGLLFFSAGTILVLDQLTKYLIRASIDIGASIPVIPGVFNITLTTNTGAAFGIFPGGSIFFIMASMTIIVLVMSMNLLNKAETAVYRISSGFVIGGALGNLIDRFIFGHVIDWLDFMIWPIFNVADSAVVVGAILLAGAILKGPKDPAGDKL